MHRLLLTHDEPVRTTSILLCSALGVADTSDTCDLDRRLVLDAFLEAPGTDVLSDLHAGPGRPSPGSPQCSGVALPPPAPRPLGSRGAMGRHVGAVRPVSQRKRVEQRLHSHFAAALHQYRRAGGKPRPHCFRELLRRVAHQQLCGPRVRLAAGELRFRGPPKRGARHCNDVEANVQACDQHVPVCLLFHCSKLSHVAQQRHPLLGARDLRQQLQSRQHAGRVGVVRIQQDGARARFPELHPHRRGLELAEPVRSRAEGNAQDAGHRRRRAAAERQVFTRAPHPHLVLRAHTCQLEAERRAQLAVLALQGAGQVPDVGVRRGPEPNPAHPWRRGHAGHEPIVDV
mmetsp:Transcript_35351/g.88676  ORF Transcript_35351/g.88676 Transcript_35351/m.88676 type:complete len:344 (-) Transcript_35351:139-1170(-)